MQGFIRLATSPEALIVQNWLVDHLESYGYDDISIHKFTYNSQQLDAGNVIVVKKGTEFPDEYIMISAHYDAVSPGANDNASGTSGVLECARLLKDYDTKRSIMFVLFNAEEIEWDGSMAFSQKCATENMNIIAHFNMDIIGWFPPGNPNTIMGAGYSYISEALFKYYQQTANIYVPSIPTIRFSFGDNVGGDHTPFNFYEYPSLYIGDLEYIGQQLCLHEPCDTIGPYQIGVNCGVNRLDLARAFVQAVLASAAELANAWLPPQNLSACSGMDKITVSWDKSGNNNSYKVFRNNVFLEETTENFYLDYDIEIGKKYEYYVIANDNGEESAPSNKDRISFVKPLELPYASDFFDWNRYGFEQSNWVPVYVNGKHSLCNTSTNNNLLDNYLSIAELDWFPIPQNIENITIRFKWQGTILSYVYNYYEKCNNVALYFEVTTDRKRWHKLGYISGTVTSWEAREFSINQYINSNFFKHVFDWKAVAAVLGIISILNVDILQILKLYLNRLSVLKKSKFLIFHLLTFRPTLQIHTLIL